jgi:hypothetical protein
MESHAKFVPDANAQQLAFARSDIAATAPVVFSESVKNTDT